ncbi:DUF1343 domain-containing protein [Gramella sp. AN32]|uniref:Exo-beta-N-acetylmuramidase NamZ domain-containing protein n=1 Tax=Christiangramia antarctica TaxID=2058158 RepID=A0ABW5X780_9FLAO|nr:DUF1343 domain-containing protein [Gramella sp. AN32]MCM4154664.1 DUF1343 domain-containing protein [Gramella sp. AN32]
MFKRLLKSTFLFFLIGIVSCGNTSKQLDNDKKETHVEQLQDSVKAEIITGAERVSEYLPLLKNKSVGVVGNQTSVIRNKQGEFVHLVDSLQSLQVDIKKVFAPEHGFRGTADAGEKINDGMDSKSGLPLISLYGNNKKPSVESLKGIDLMIFDIQDVGARFYTYISTLHYIMEACAENNIPLLILDRPNPNGHYIDGPILELKNQSFVGMHPIPIVHGMTIGEYAQMINGEKWLKNGVQTNLQVIKVENYDHQTFYSIPIKPSPNLPNDLAINLYPSLCFFEGTNVNAGRGTTKQFQVYGSPFLNAENYHFFYTPMAMEGAQNPKHLGKKCIGEDLSENDFLDHINLDWLISAYQNTSDTSKFFNSFFVKLAGTDQLQKQIEQGLSSDEIRNSWKEGLKQFEGVRTKYLLY